MGQRTGLVSNGLGDGDLAHIIDESRQPDKEVSQETLALADWTILLTDVETKRLNLVEALVLLRERWQMELLYKLWKQDGQVDEWHTTNRLLHPMRNLRQADRLAAATLVDRPL